MEWIGVPLSWIAGESLLASSLSVCIISLHLHNVNQRISSAETKGSTSQTKIACNSWLSLWILVQYLEHPPTNNSFQKLNVYIELYGWGTRNSHALFSTS